LSKPIETHAINPSKDSATHKSHRGLSLVSDLTMKRLGAHPCARCNVLPGFSRTKIYEDRQALHVFRCDECGNEVGNFLEPNGLDEAYKHWNDAQKKLKKEMKSSMDTPNKSK